MEFKTETEKRRALKKVEIAIDKMVDLQDDGVTLASVGRVLDSLRMLESDMEECTVARGAK